MMTATNSLGGSWEIARKETGHIDTEYRRALTEALLNDDVDKDFDKARKAFRFQGNDQWLDALIAAFGYDAYFRSIALCKNRYKRRKRVEDKTRDIILAGECLFLTLTFNDETLSKTTPETRRRYVARWLKTTCNTYVANIDFGGKNGREHYHALVYAEKVDYSGWHQYGAVKGERVRTGNADVKRVTKYVVKLSRHAQKETTKNVRMIYSRNTAHLPPAYLFE